VPPTRISTARPTVSPRPLLATLKLLQLLTSLGLVGLAWMIYPGTTVVPAMGAASCYVVAAVLAMRDYRIGIWLAFACSVLTAAFASYGVYRYVVNGFDFLSGTDGRIEPVYLPPYGFLLVAAASVVVVLMHAGAWRWMLRGSAAAGAS
jgi:hypothetical protein